MASVNEEIAALLREYAELLGLTGGDLGQPLGDDSGEPSRTMIIDHRSTSIRLASDLLVYRSAGNFTGFG